MKKKVKEFFKKTLDELNDEVLGRIYATLKVDPQLRSSLNPAFPFPKEIRMGILDNCFAVEYVGPSDDSDEPLKTNGVLNPSFDIYDFLGIDIKHLHHISIPTPNDLTNMAFFLGDSIPYLTDYFYDFTQMPAEFIQLNGFLDFSKVSRPTYISNTTFFWTNENGDLKIKHIDFLEIFPLNEKGDVLYHDVKSLEYFGQFLLDLRVPTYRIKLHKQLNEFIQFINLPDVTEPQITKFLEQNPEILQISFGVNDLNPQCLLKWQYDTDKTDLQPDFLPVRMDGFADILEFKLPHLKSKPIVGTSERKHPSFEVDTAISQLDLYEEWCEQEVNLKWLENDKGIKILKPQRYLVIGHSEEFTKEERARLRKTRNTTVFTYDEFIEMARFQVYRIK